MKTSSSRNRKYSIVLSMLALAAVACVCTGILPFGGDSSGSDGPAAASGPPPPCIVTPEEVSAQLGVGVADQSEQNETRCRHELDNDSTLLVDVIDEGSPEAAQQDYQDWYDNNTDEDSDASQVVIIDGLGDAAFFNTASGILSGYSGQYRFSTHYVGPGAADYQDELTALAGLMVSRLGGTSSGAAPVDPPEAVEEPAEEAAAEGSGAFAGSGAEESAPPVDGYDDSDVQYLGPIAVGETLSGTLESEDVRKGYTFNATSGDSFVITVVPSADLDIIIYVREPDSAGGDATFYQDLEFEGGTEILEANLYDTGEFRIILEPFFSSGDYTLTLEAAP